MGAKKQAKAAKPADLPPADQPVSPEHVLEREDRQRKPAAYAAVLSAILVAVGVILEQMLASKAIPDFQQADVVSTMAAAQAGQDLPPSFLTAVGEFQIENASQTIAIGTLRGVAVLLLIPIVLLIIRGARERGAPVPRLLDPIVIAGMAMVGVLSVVTAVLEPGFYREARELGFAPEQIRDAYKDSGLVGLSFLGLFAALMAGIPISMASVQAMRVGLMPRLLGFMGVLIGILFVMPALESTGLLRSIYFAVIAFILVGKFGDGLPEAWKTGRAVEPQPREPRQPKTSLEKA